MSLVRAALRIATVKALKGVTAAEDRVADSDMTPLASAVTAGAKPVAVIYTDDDEHTITGLEILSPTGGTKTIVVQMAITSISTVRDPTSPDNGASFFSFPNTDEALELVLDIMERQVTVALMDPNSDWGDMWRRLVNRVHRWKSIRGATDRSGARFAARQILIQVEPISEPLIGEEPEEIWTDFAALLASNLDPDVSALGPRFTALITGQALAGFKLDALNLGLDRKSAAIVMTQHPFLGVPDGGVGGPQSGPYPVEELDVDDNGLPTP